MTTLIRKSITRSYGKTEVINLTLFSFGKFVSVFGSRIYTFAVGLYILNLTGSGLSFGITMALGTIPVVLVSPLAGVLADRINRKTLVITMDFANGLLFAAVYIFSGFLGLGIELIYASIFLMAVFASIFTVSMETAKPSIVSKNNLMRINAISKIIDSVSGILGPMIGGVIFVVIDIRLFILINGISYLISGMTEIFIDFRFNEEAETKKNQKMSVLFDLREGWRYIMDRKSLRRMIGVFICINFFIGFTITTPLPFIINHALALDSRVYGMVQSGFPIGMIIGALVVKNLRSKYTYERLLKRMSLLLGSLMVFIGIPVALGGTFFQNITLSIYYTVMTTIIGGAIALVDIPLFYEIQTVIPKAYRGRVLSLGMAMAKVVLPIAFILSGSLMNQIPVEIIPISGGFLLIIFTTALLQ